MAITCTNDPDFISFPLGFWFAHQGSIFVFIVLILVYCVLMDKLDHAATKSEGSE